MLNKCAAHSSIAPIQQNHRNQLSHINIYFARPFILKSAFWGSNFGGYIGGYARNLVAIFGSNRDFFNITQYR